MPDESQMAAAGDLLVRIIEEAANEQHGPVLLASFDENQDLLERLVVRLSRDAPPMQRRSIAQVIHAICFKTQFKSIRPGLNPFMAARELEMPSALAPIGIACCRHLANHIETLCAMILHHDFDSAVYVLVLSSHCAQNQILCVYR
jgi:hypothetical protein